MKKPADTISAGFSAYRATKRYNDFSLFVALPVQISNLFLMDLRRLASIAI